MLGTNCHPLSDNLTGGFCCRSFQWSPRSFEVSRWWSHFDRLLSEWWNCLSWSAQISSHKLAKLGTPDFFSCRHSPFSTTGKIILVLGPQKLGKWRIILWAEENPSCNCHHEKQKCTTKSCTFFRSVRLCHRSSTLYQTRFPTAAASKHCGHHLEWRRVCKVKTFFVEREILKFAEIGRAEAVHVTEAMKFSRLSWVNFWSFPRRTT